MCDGVADVLRGAGHGLRGGLLVGGQLVIRRVMWFLVGVLIAALPRLAYAETWDGSPTYSAGYPDPNVPGSSIMDACRNAEASGATGAYGGKCAVETSPGNYAQYSQRVA